MSKLKRLASRIRCRWNTIQFPSDNLSLASQLPTAESSRHPWLGRAQLALLVIAGLFLFSNLSYPLIDRDETRYAEIPREMLATNNWVLPQLNFAPYYDKPPLLYWCCALSYSVFGISEWSARLVPALAAYFTLLATLWLGTRNFGPRVGLLSATVLLLSVGFAFTSRYLLIDGLFSLFVTLSFFAAYEAIQATKVRLGWWLVASICCGVACLAKGPLSFVLLLPPVFLFAWLSESFAKPRWWHYALLLTTVAAVTAPWLIAVTLQDPTFIIEFLVRHNVQRFAGEFHAKPFWYFVPVLLLAGHPWSFLAIPYAQFLFNRNPLSAAARPPILGFMLLWAAWCFVFFSMSSCKLPTYLLPAAPALALMIGHYLSLVLSDSPEHLQFRFARFWSARMATVTTCVAGIGFVIFNLCTGLEISLATCFWGALWAVLLICTVLLFGEHQHGRNVWLTTAGFAFLLVLMGMHYLVPEYSRAQTVFGVNTPLVEHANAVHDQPLVTISHEFSEVPFYLQRSDIVHMRRADAAKLNELVAQHGDTMVVLDRSIDVGKLRSKLSSDVIFQAVVQQGPATILLLSSGSFPSRLATSISSDEKKSR